MNTVLECIPCFVRQAFDSIKMATTDEAVQERVLRAVLLEISRMDLCESPPVIGQQIHRLIRSAAEDNDPYRELKKRFNRLALNLAPRLRERVKSSRDPLQTALRLAIAGNIIDFGPHSSLSEDRVQRVINEALTESLDPGAVKELRLALDDARSILYIGDNAGEIVFDRLLIEQFPYNKITFAVRGRPVINDATMADVQETGMSGFVQVIDSGSDAPGIILDDCSGEFRDKFDEAELIIAKGQGNYESLGSSGIGKNISYLLYVKCPVIARHVGAEVGSFVLKNESCR